MSGIYYENTEVSGCSEFGINFHQVSVTEIIGNKNGVKLQQITMTETKKIRYELYIDGDLINIYYNLKIAKSMFKDFSA